MAKKKGSVLRDYEREFSLLKSRVSSGQKRGYIYDPFVQSLLSSPITTPNRRDVELLHDLRGAVLTSHAEINTAQGRMNAQTYVTEKRRRQAERNFHIQRESESPEAQEKYGARGAETLKNIREIISQWSPMKSWSEWFSDLKAQDKNTLERYLDAAIGNLGETTVAQNLERHAQMAIMLANEICYGSGSSSRYVGKAIARGNDGRVTDTAQALFTSFLEILYGDVTWSMSREATAAAEAYNPANEE